MSDFEEAKRLTAWTWAAETLGVEASAERLAGLVEVTHRIRVENLRPALEVVIQTEPRGFLPSPGAVISAANRIADRKRSDTPRIESGRDMSHEAHRKLMEELNPQGWTDEQSRAHARLINARGTYAQKIDALNDERHEWAAEQVLKDIAARPVSHGLRIKMRREYNTIARVRFAGPDPLEWGEAS